MTTRYTQDSTPTNPFGIGYFQQGVDTSKKLIAERQARDVELVAQSNAIDTRTPARELAAAQASGNAQSIAAAEAKYQATLAEKDAIRKEIDQNTALLASTEEGLRRNETALALAGARAANTPPGTVIVNAGNDSAANSTPPVYTVPLNETTPNSSRAAPVTSETPTPAQNIASIQAAAPTPFDPNQDEFGNLGAAQATVAENNTAINNPALVTDEDEALRAAAAEADEVVAENNRTVDDQDPFEAARLRAIEEEEDNEPRVFTAEDLDVDALSDEAILAQQQQQALNRAALQGEDRVDAAATSAAANRAKNQSTLQTRVNQPAAADWRVRLRLAPNADYLYKVPAGNDPNSGPGILAPLAATDGVVFPYTPSIETSYQAKYDSYDLTHSNYRGYFYKNSTVENITIKGTFTAQDTREAQYLLAVIHFFKSVTKMFYGQDQQAGTPPPLVYLSGFGKYQFNENPCVVTNFGYSLPNDVDYIRANGFNNIGLNMENRRSQSSGPAIGGSLGTVVSIIDRLTNAGLGNGSLTNRPSPSQVNQNVANQTSINSTYVPTKMEISITLLPMQTRNQVSKQFSLKSFANGSLLAGGGFW